MELKIDKEELKVLANAFLKNEIEIEKTVKSKYEVNDLVKIKNVSEEKIIKSKLLILDDDDHRYNGEILYMFSNYGPTLEKDIEYNIIKPRE